MAAFGAACNCPHGGMMSTAVEPILWLFGIPPEAQACIREAAGQGYGYACLDDLPEEDLEQILDRADKEDPLLLWVGGAAWTRQSRTVLQALHTIPTVILLERQSPRELLEQALEAPVQQVMLGPLTPVQVHQALGKAREARNVYSELYCMTREVHMGREIMERKNMVCSFLFQWFEHAGEQYTALELVRHYAAIVQSLEGCKGMHVAWWGDSGYMNCLLGSGNNEQIKNAWLGFFYEQSRSFIPEIAPGNILQFDSRGCKPEQGNTLLLPLVVRNRICGMMALPAHKALLQSRDMARALDAASRHLALALWEGQGREGFWEQEVLAVSPMDQNQWKSRIAL